MIVRVTECGHTDLVEAEVDESGEVRVRRIRFAEDEDGTPQPRIDGRWTGEIREAPRFRLDPALHRQLLADLAPLRDRRGRGLQENGLRRRYDFFVAALTLIEDGAVRFEHEVLWAADKGLRDLIDRERLDREVFELYERYTDVLLPREAVRATEFPPEASTEDEEDDDDDDDESSEYSDDDEYDEYDDDDDDAAAAPARAQVTGPVPAYFVGMGGRDVRIVLAGDSVFTGEGEDIVVQRFDDPRAARQHLDLVLQRHRRQGYAITERRLDGAELMGVIDPSGAADELAGLVEWEADQRRLTITFREPADVRRCRDLVARAAELSAGWVQVICDPVSPGPALAEALAARPLPELVCFAFDTHFQTLTRQRANDPGDLARLLSGLPGLERLFATGDLDLRPTAHARLAELYLLGDPLRASTLDALGRSRFPALEVLGLCVASDAGPPDARAVAAALRSVHAPALSALEIAGLGDLCAFLDALTAQPLPDAWTSLRVTGSVRDEDELLALLAARAQRLSALQQIGLPLDELSTGAAEHARRIVPELEDAGELGEYLTPATYRNE